MVEVINGVKNIKNFNNGKGLASSPVIKSNGLTSNPVVNKKGGNIKKSKQVAKGLKILESKHQNII